MSYFFPDFSVEKSGLRIIHEGYITFSIHLLYYIRDGMTESDFYLLSKLVFFFCCQREICL